MANISARPQEHSNINKARRDPEFRPTTGGFDGLKLLNKEPGKSYVAVDPNLDHGEVYNDYVNRGYQPVIAKNGGPSFVAGKTAKEGNPVEVRGLVLMSIDQSVVDERNVEAMANAQARLREIRGAREIRRIGKEYRGVDNDATITADIDIPSRGRE